MKGPAVVRPERPDKDVFPHDKNGVYRGHVAAAVTHLRRFFTDSVKRRLRGALWVKQEAKVHKRQNKVDFFTL